LSDEKNRDDRYRAENNSGIKNGTSCEQTGRDRGEDIPGVIEGFVAPDAKVESAPPHESEPKPNSE